MKVTIALVLAVLSLCMIAGCAHGGLYLVPNPGAVFAPPAVPAAKVKAFQAFSLLEGRPTMSVLFANGESFKGPSRMTLVSSARKDVQYSQSSAPPRKNLADVWDAIYGKGYFLSHYGKVNPKRDNFFFQAILTGSRGTILQVEVGGGEVCTPNNADDKDPMGSTCEWDYDGTGVAVDNKGNTYRYSDHI